MCQTNQRTHDGYRLVVCVVCSALLCYVLLRYAMHSTAQAAPALTTPPLLLLVVLRARRRHGPPLFLFLFLLFPHLFRVLLHDEGFLQDQLGVDQVASLFLPHLLYLSLDGFLFFLFLPYVALDVDRHRLECRVPQALHGVGQGLGGVQAEVFLHPLLFFLLLLGGLPFLLALLLECLVEGRFFFGLRQGVVFDGVPLVVIVLGLPFHEGLPVELVLEEAIDFLFFGCPLRHEFDLHLDLFLEGEARIGDLAELVLDLDGDVLLEHVLDERASLIRGGSGGVVVFLVVLFFLVLLFFLFLRLAVAGAGRVEGVASRLGFLFLFLLFLLGLRLLFFSGALGRY
mmetsp:Transcript_5367/g.12264  ORF Transcript_5367/g.12264 Transcript_5367/m.12264 type:complete len:342 (+) Transcript_5367:1736-2761(+)